MKKLMRAFLFILLVLSVLWGCEGGKKKPFDSSKEIIVVSREEGSGTRGAFVDFFGLVEKGEGTRTDRTTKEAIISKQTDVMIQNISSNPYAVGYVSLGSLSDEVKALRIEGIEPTPENVKKGSYPVFRPFILATGNTRDPLSQDFIDFILSKQGQSLISKNYVAVAEDPKDWIPKRITGKIVISGSTSVAPVIEKLKEAYAAQNPKAILEIQQSDSASGMRAVEDGTASIAMVSRYLSAEEEAKLSLFVMARDGIVVIVNKKNPISDLRPEQVRRIYRGDILIWRDIYE